MLFAQNNTLGKTILQKYSNCFFGCKKGCKSRNCLIYTLYCGERGIRTPGTHKEFNSFRDCPVRPLRHLSFNSGCKYTQKPRAMQMNLFNLHCRGATVYVAVRPNIRKSQKQMNLFNLHCRGAQYMRRSRIYAETESNANEFFQSYQNFCRFNTEVQQPGPAGPGC